MILPWYIPLLMFAPFEAVVVISVSILIILFFIAYWIPKYYGTIVYKLTEDEIVWVRGVWFKNTGIVPYNRITNIDISQGPISRRLRIASPKIQTAGYSAQQSRAEIKIDGIVRFEELRDTIMGFVKGRKPVSVELYDSKSMNADILNKLIRIREILERLLKK